MNMAELALGKGSKTNEVYKARTSIKLKEQAEKQQTL